MSAHVPQPNRAVKAGCGDDPPVAAERHAADTAGVTVQDPDGSRSSGARARREQAAARFGAWTRLVRRESQQ
jgi:hypothetical protein